MQGKKFGRIKQDNATRVIYKSKNKNSHHNDTNVMAIFIFLVRHTGVEPATY